MVCFLLILTLDTRVVYYFEESGNLWLYYSSKLLLMYDTGFCFGGALCDNTPFIYFLKYLYSFLAYFRVGSLVGSASTWHSDRGSYTQENFQQLL